MSCSFPSVKATKAAFPPDYDGDRLFFVPFFRLVRSLQNHLYSPNTEIQLFFKILPQLDLKLEEVSDRLVSLHIVIHLLKKLMMGPLEYGGREEKKKIIDKQGPQRQSPKGITIPQDVSKMMRCTPFPSLLKKGSSQQCQKN